MHHSIYFDEELKDKATKEAKKKDISLSKFIMNLIRSYFESKPKTETKWVEDTLITHSFG